MVPAFPVYEEDPGMRDSGAGLCLPLEQLDLHSESSPCLRKGDASSPFPLTSELSFHLPCSAYSGFSRDFFPGACLNAAGLEEPPKPNSDISWPTALVVRDKYPTGRKSLLSPLRGKPLLHWQALWIGKILLGVTVVFVC